MPAGVEVAIGDLLEQIAFGRTGHARRRPSCLLLNAVVADELTQALIAYGIARRVGLKHVTYLSVFKVDGLPRRAALCVESLPSRTRCASRCSVHHLAAGLLFSRTTPH